MNSEILAIIALALAAIPAVMFLWNLPQLKAPEDSVGQACQPAGAGDFPVARSGAGNTGLESPVNRQAGKPALQPVSTLIPARNESACDTADLEVGATIPISEFRLKAPTAGVGQACRPAGADDFPVARFGAGNTGLESPVNRQAGKPALLPVSILIPARNESANIRGALSSVLQNRGVEFEVIVLDDHSADDTAAIVREFAACDARVRLEPAPTLSPGWCGKQHACHVLSRHARHPLLLFMDADVRLAPDALVRMSAFMSADDVVNRNSQFANRVALASGVPRQITGTFLEQLLIPLIHFVLLGFLPVWRMRRSPSPAYGAGCGQLFIARANAYRAAGGHAAIPDSLHDGLKLPRAFRRAGFRTDLFDATEIATCRMYCSAGEVVDGLTKNAHEGLAAPAQIGPWTLLLFGGHVLPWVLLLGSCWLEQTTVVLAIAAAGLSLVPRLLAASRFQQSWPGTVLHPVGVLVLLLIQWRAFFRSFNRQPQMWKGRFYRTRPAEAAAAIPPNGPSTIPTRSL